MKRMLTLLLSLTVLLLIGAAAAEPAYTGYVPLDSDLAEAIAFDGTTVTWNGQTFTLDENTFFLDARLDAAQIEGNPYAFNDVSKALAALHSGTAEKPMVLLTAPGVYWVDDPDVDIIRDNDNGPTYWGTPVGAHLTVDHLHFYGLSKTADNVVFAVNRGQQMGAQGNFTMFAIEGVGLRSENVTFGNYCNVDLDFPLDPTLSRKMRSEVITQAQLFFYTGGDGVAINTNFISRLNLTQFAKYYDGCHLESGGHANGGYYVNCTLELYNKNFSGAYFFNCDLIFTPYDSNWQGYDEIDFGMVDGSGNGLFLIDSRFRRGDVMVENNVGVDINWDNIPRRATTRAYQLNVTLDGEPIVIQERSTPGATIVLTDEDPLAKGFKVVHDGQTYYNIPNITGEDPFGVMKHIKAAAVADGKAEDAYLTIPVRATASVDLDTIRSGSTSATLTYGTTTNADTNWVIATADEAMAKYVQIVDHGDGTATINGTNDEENEVTLVIEARSGLGLEAAVQLTVEPSYVEAPIAVDPVVTAPVDGVAALQYTMDLGLDTRVEQSVINWYRVKDAQGSEPLALTVSRLDVPEKTYTLSKGDVGYYLMATIQPKHNRSDLGDMVTIISEAPVKAEDVTANFIRTNFLNLPVADQHDLIPGTWSLDGYAPAECVKKPYVAAESGNWDVLNGLGGALGHTALANAKQGARIFYQPVGETFGSMKTTVIAVPFKEAGQGFGSANNQFLEVYVKFDRETMTGYGVRLERLNADEVAALGYNNGGAGKAVAASLVEYRDGVATHLTKRVMTSAFIGECTITLEAKDGVLTANITSNVDGVRGSDVYDDYLREVTLTADYTENGLGGTGALNTGTSNPYMTTNCNYTMFTFWESVWGE